MNSTPHPRPGNADVPVGGFSSLGEIRRSASILAGGFSSPRPSPISSFCPLVSAFPKFYPFSFHTLAHSFALFCVFLHLPKTQLFSFQSVPHSLQKTTRGGGTLQFDLHFFNTLSSFYAPYFPSPLLSFTYELKISQPLCFDILPSNGVCPPCASLNHYLVTSLLSSSQTRSATAVSMRLKKNSPPRT